MTAEWIDAKEVARRYGYCASTIRDWARRCLIPNAYGPTGSLRFPLDEIEAYFRGLVRRPAVEAQETPGKAAEWRS